MGLEPGPGDALENEIGHQVVEEFGVERSVSSGAEDAALMFREGATDEPFGCEGDAALDGVAGPVVGPGSI